MKILILTGAAFSLKATLPGAQWHIHAHTHTYTYTHTQSGNQSGSVVGKGVLLFFPLPWR